MHHRVAEHFREGRCFLAGDAGHVHSPVGGQGMIEPDLASAAAALSLPVHVFAWGEDASAAGFHRDAVYLIRPDGYVGLALPRPEPERVRAYAARHGLTFRLAAAGR